MRTTVDIPDPLYRELKAKAAREGSTVKQFILRSVEAKLAERKSKRPKRLVLPIIKSKKPGTLYLDNAKIAELVPFP